MRPVKTMADQLNPKPDSSAQPPSSASESAPPPSMASRIQSSASGLLSSTVSGSSTGAVAGHDASATLAANLAEKDGGSSSQQPPTSFNRPSGGGGSKAGGIVGDTFRSPAAPRSDHAMDSFANSSSHPTDSSLQLNGESTIMTAPSPAGPQSVTREQLPHGGSGYVDSSKKLQTFMEEIAHSPEPTRASYQAINPFFHDPTGIFQQFDDESANPNDPLPEPQAQTLRDFAAVSARRLMSTPNFHPDEIASLERAWGSSSAAGPHAPGFASDDGQAVVSLLSDPSFEPASYIHDEDNDDITTSPNPYLPSSAPPPPPPVPDTLSPLALVPGTNQNQTDTAWPARTQDPNQQNRDLATLSSIVSPSDEPWLSLDALYHEEVYGNYLAPYVEAAKKEVAEYQPSAEDEEEDVKVKALREGKAVRRLQMTLGHVRDGFARDVKARLTKIPEGTR